MNNYSTEVKSDLANYVDNIGRVSIRIMKAKKSVLKYEISVTLQFISTSSDSLIIIKEKLGEFENFYKIRSTTNTRAELNISSIYIIKELLNALLPYIVKKQEHALKALEIITLFEKCRKSKEKLNLFLQVCALVDQYQDLYHYTEKTVNRRFHRHTEKTVSEYFKTKVV